MEVQELIDILTAFKAGKTIQIEHEYVSKEAKLCSKWTDAESFESIIRNISLDNNMRVKPEPKCRPYNNADEFVKASQEHKDLLRAKYDVGGKAIKYLRPTSITEAYAIGVGEDGPVLYSWLALLRNFVWNDDSSPCGVVEEQEE